MSKDGRLDLAAAQRTDEVGLLVCDGDPLAQPLDLIGAPVAELEGSADQPQANVAVRLCHVGPDGASHRISVGVLNLTHCESHEEPAALQPGRRYRARIVLDDVGYRVPAGHRLRVALSRSEEHTSELQSLMRISYAVFCLNKKKSSTRRRTT